MPQLIKRLHARMWSPTGDVFDDRPQFALLFSRIANSWNMIEFRLEGLFGSCMHKDKWTAVSLFSELNNIGPRLQMLTVALAEKTNPELTNEFTAKKDAIRKRNGERSRIVHGFWCHPTPSGDEPDLQKMWPDPETAANCVILVQHPVSRPDAPAYLYTAQDFIDVHRRILVLWQWLDDYSKRVQSHLQESKKASQQEP